MPRCNALKNGYQSLPEGECAGAESQRGMMQDNLKLVCADAVT